MKRIKTNLKIKTLKHVKKPQMKNSQKSSTHFMNLEQSNAKPHGKRDKAKKRKSQPILLLKIDVEMLDEILANGIQQF